MWQTHDIKNAHDKYISQLVFLHSTSFKLFLSDLLCLNGKISQVFYAVVWKIILLKIIGSVAFERNIEIKLFHVKC